MTKINTKTRNPHPTPKTHEGAPAVFDSKERELRRAVLSCLLWEDNFYESGEDIATRIRTLATAVEPEKVAALAIEARHTQHLRHVPLQLLVALAKTGSGIPHLTQNAIVRVVSRPDELGELLALYWKQNPPKTPTTKRNKAPLPGQFKKGLRQAVLQFDQYQLTKWNRDADVQIRDVIFLTHAAAGFQDQGKLFSSLVNKDHLPDKLKSIYGFWDKLEPPETWEVELSKPGADKKAVWTRLLTEERLGYMAVLRNLRNMFEAGVDPLLVQRAIVARKGAHNVLPFRYIAAARHAPNHINALDEALQATVDGMPKLPGKTAILVDVSGSMDSKLSGKSELLRMDAAGALAVIAPCEYKEIYSFSNYVVGPIAARGIQGIDQIKSSQTNYSTYLGLAVRRIDEMNKFDRIIVVTDEQSADRVVPPAIKHRYMINVAGYRNSVASDKDWNRIEGFSENVIRYIEAIESFDGR